MTNEEREKIMRESLEFLATDDIPSRLDCNCKDHAHEALEKIKGL